MNRRELLKIGTAGILGIASTKLVKAEASFEPDVIIDIHHPLFSHATAYLNGIEQGPANQIYCFGSHIKWDSFERPAFGRLVIGSMREGRLAYIGVDTLLPGEFVEQESALVHIEEGQVRITLTAEGRRILAKLRTQE